VKLSEYEQVVQVFEEASLRALKTYEILIQDHPVDFAAMQALDEAEEYFCARLDKLVEVDYE
jgi:hypothetical protein